MNKTDVNEDRQFSLAMLLMTAVLVIGTGHFKVEGMNADVFAINYRNGVLPRGFIGWLYDILCSAFGNRLYNYLTVLILCTISYFIYLAILWKYSKKMIRALEGSDYAKAFIITVSPMFIKMFLSEGNFGRTDMFLLLLSIGAGYAIMKQHGLVLAVVFPVIAVLIHEGYVLTFYNVVIACFIYRIVTSEGRKRTINIFWLGVSLILVAVSFLWVYLLCRVYVPISQEYYDSIYYSAEFLSAPDSHAHYGFLMYVLFGMDLYQYEDTFRIIGSAELPLFFILSAPFTIKLVSFFRSLYRESSNKKLVVLLSLGSLTLLPDFILKCDYGRWVFALYSYYIVLLVLFIISNNTVVKKVFREQLSIVYKSSWRGLFYAMYFMLFLPFQCTHVSDITEDVIFLVKDIFLGRYI
ncbi:MAG: hypothetical protein IJ757_05750 [Clostridiales bacterium]|nr:hypothetical protein [Clostridiales bacterium]